MSKTRGKGAGKVIVCRIERCLGCRSCEMACALEHSESQNLREAVLEDPLPQRRVTVEAAGGHGLPLQCRHCDDAPCVMVCPTGAIQRHCESGPVIIDRELCIGCKLCMVVCPFGVIGLERDGKGVIKCDQCIARQEAGEEPACVSACPTKALVFMDIEQYARQKRQATAEQLVTVPDQANEGDDR